jgi:hypothetical protein
MDKESGKTFSIKQVTEMTRVSQNRIEVDITADSPKRTSN